MATAGEDGGLDPAAVRWAAALWAPDPAVRADGRASPLHAADLHGLPPAVVITAAPDPLRDEGDAYARRLADAGVPVTHRTEPGLPHDFMQAMGLVSPAAAAGLARVIADVTGVLGTR
ncbi:MAG TPA: alpha/beta hydrolase fold domain-containing protein [Baekduia sp.]|jgi:acetyl esterase